MTRQAKVRQPKGGLGYEILNWSGKVKLYKVDLGLQKEEVP
jgi:hypothetical protein